MRAANFPENLSAKQSMKVIWLAAAALFASACSSFQVSALDPKTGYLKASVKATTIINKPFDL